MYVYRISPTISGLPFDYLSYFSSEHISLGSLVSVTVKKKKVQGIVVGREEGIDEKLAIKSADFVIKKIEGDAPIECIDEDLLSSLTSFSLEALIPLPLLITTVFPQRLFHKKESARIYANKKEKRSELGLLSLPKEERETRYKSLARESFAKNESIIIVFPTIHELKEMAPRLQKGIEEYSLLFHSDLTQKELKESDEKLLTPHPLLILTTPSLYSFSRNDIGLIILENEISQHYISMQSLDFRELFIHLFKTLRVPTLCGGRMPSLARFALYEEGKAVETYPLYLRGGDSIQVVEMNGSKGLISPYLSKESIKELELLATEKRGHHFIYTQRKGMYPSTVCADCSTLLTCKDCQKPLILHTVGSSKMYMCHHCDTVIRIQEESPIYCAVCGGWRMKTLGIASSGIEELLRQTNIPVFVIDGERTKSKKEVEEVYTKWRESPVGILIGTELALHVLKECDSSTIASLDSLFSLPEYGIDEKIVSLVTLIREKTKGAMILQTRMIKNPLFKHLTDYTYLTYYKWALEERRNLHLPPYYTIIKAQFMYVSKEEKERRTELLLEKKLEHAWFESGPQSLMLFIHIPKEDWERDEKLRYFVLGVTEESRISCNPKQFFSV